MVEIAAGNVRETLQKWILAQGLDLVWDPEGSSGSFLRDAVHGADYLDFFGFFGSRPLGFNHPKLSAPEFLERLTKIAVHKPSNCDIYSVEYAQFTDTFATVALQEQFKHVFFIEGGSPAVENACKAAMDWKHRKNHEAGRGEKGSQILHFKQAFHGRTGYCLSLTDSHDQRKTRFYPTFDWPRVLNPKMRFPETNASISEVEALEEQSLQEIAGALEERGDDIAAILIEPIQGEGGDNYFRTEFLRALRRIADEREILLIFDEVQTGFGATGRWWDWMHHDVKPDLMVFGKKSHVCGFAATERIDEVDGVFRTPSRISSTFAGNLTDMVRCQRTIEIIVEDDLIAQAQTMGNYLLKCLRDVEESFESVTQVRGRGLWAAFDLPNMDVRDEVVRACFEERLLVLPCGTHSVRFRPCLDVGADAVGRAGAQLEVALKRVLTS